MKVSKAVAAAHHQALLEAAGAIYRERGFATASIAEIGARAGLSHGALYAHFDSKETLQSAAVGELFDWTAAQVVGAPDLNAVLDLYLSRQHVDHPGAGCPLAALGGDTARADRRTRKDFAAGLRRLIDAFAARVGKRDAKTRRTQAITAIAAMVGAVVLARAAGDRALSDEILGTVRKGLAGV